MKKTLLLLCLCHTTVYAEMVDKTVAIVGKELILASDVDELLSLELSEKIDFKTGLNELVNNAILVSDCKKFGVYPTENEVKDQIGDIKRQNGLNDEQFRMQLLRAGITPESYESRMYFELCKTKIIQSKIRNRVNISKRDIERVLEKRTGRSNNNEKIRALSFAISSNTEAESQSAQKIAKNVYDALIRDEPVEQITKLSQGAIAVSQVDFGIISKYDAVGDLADVLFSDSTQDVRGPVELGGQFYVFKILERIKDDASPLADEEKELYKQLFEAEIERLLRQHIAEARASTYVEIFQ